MGSFLKKILYFLPIQLFLLSIRRYPIFLLIWLLVLSIATGQLGVTYGAPNLFFDPEYLGKTGYLSFVLVGMGFGAFYVSWNLNCYILHSPRFTFLAGFRRPMGIFFINNSIIPLIFIVAYFYNVVHYQSKFEFSSTLSLVMDLIGFIAGTTLVVLLTSFYYSFTNRDKIQYRDNKNSRWKMWIRKRDLFSKPDFDKVRIESLLTQRLSIIKLRDLSLNEHETAHIIFRQHHINALFAQVVIFLLILTIGFFMDNPLFQIPVIASCLLFLSILISLFGVMIFWTGKWSVVIIVLFFVFANYLSQYDFLGYKSAAYGLDYGLKEKRAYNIREFRALASDSNIRSDTKYFTKILENWKSKQSKYTKPKIVFINASGGGSRSAMFTSVVLQHADSLLHHQLFHKIFLMSGASGGMLGLAEMRELFLEKQLGAKIDMNDHKYAYELAGDLLNPMFVSLLSNDIFIPIHRFKLDSMVYFKDRGYMMEQQFMKNLEGRLDKRIKDYRDLEFNATVPLLIAHTTVVSDARRFYFSPHPVRFLMRQTKEYQSNTLSEVDAIDYCSYFKKEKGENTRVTSALRMNATFPFILPNTQLPTDPPVYLMDGGAADNFGAETTVRFLQTFKDWINENTSGVIIIQIRDSKKEDDQEDNYKKKSVVSTMLDPIGQFISNLENYQDFRIDQELNFTNQALKVKTQMITFEYVPEKKEETAALSLHLTEREKRNIISSLNSANNKFAFDLLNEWVK